MNLPKINPIAIVVIIGIIVIVVMFMRNSMKGGSDEHSNVQNQIFGEKLRSKTKSILLQQGCNISGNQVKSKEGWPSFYEKDKRREDFTVEWAMGCVIDAIQVIDDDQTKYYEERQMEKKSSHNPSAVKHYFEENEDDYSEHVRNRSRDVDVSSPIHRNVTEPPLRSRTTNSNTPNQSKNPNSRGSSVNQQQRVKQNVTSEVYPKEPSLFSHGAMFGPSENVDDPNSLVRDLDH